MESLSKETGDFVSDHLFATLRHQFEKGTSRAKAVKFAKKLFHKRQAVGRMYDYLDDVARAALYEFVEAEDVLEEEVEQLGKIAQTYQAKTEKALTKTQLDDLLGDSSLGTKSVEEVVAGLQGLSQERIDYYLNLVRGNPESDTVILGINGKYSDVGKRKKYTYFNISDELWESLQREALYNNDEIWKVNKRFIDEQIAANKKILLTDNPFKKYYNENGMRFYQRELNYLKNLGYVFEKVDAETWIARR